MPGPGELNVYDPSSVLLGNFAGHRNSLDACIDEASQTVIHVGWRQTSAPDPVSGNNLPVQIAYFRGHAYDGTIKYTGYDWSTDPADAGYLNTPENLMADTRGYRAEVGEDGKLYLGFECAGGNHIFRYQPWLDANDSWINALGLLVGGDSYHEFYGSASEHKTFVGRYEPGTGEYLLGQQFCTRLQDTGNANAPRIESGSLHVDAEGRLYLGVTAASGDTGEHLTPGLPYTYNPGELASGYGGGASLIVMSPDFSERLFVGRVSNRGHMRAIAVGQSDTDRVIFAGGSKLTANPLATLAATQGTSGGGGGGERTRLIPAGRLTPRPGSSAMLGPGHS